MNVSRHLVFLLRETKRLHYKKSMAENQTQVVIESRVHLFGALAEAAETEHNLMCLYLYAMFGMKRTVDEGLSAKELGFVERWRKLILQICLEEMNHLSLVANLFSAIGATPHFMRPNFPVSPGLYPAELTVELAPFDLKTLEHFIFLERPASFEMHDADTFQSARYERVAPRDRLMPTSGDYKTVGELYQAIREALIRLSAEVGEKEFFCGSPSRQITPIDSPLPGLSAVTDLASALKAVDTIVTQGEGASEIENSHFIRFTQIKNEYLQLLSENPEFQPGRRVARNPVMRKPINPEHKVWVTHPISARLMDLANALYAFMLRTLVQVYLVEERSRDEKHTLLEISFTIMHLMAVVGETLTLLPANEGKDCFAGMSFAMLRTLNPLAKENELNIMQESLKRFHLLLSALQVEVKKEQHNKALLGVCMEQLDVAKIGVEKLIARLQSLQKARDLHGASVPKTEEKKESDQRNAPPPSPEVEIADGKEIQIQFDSKKCIHSRHCVTELPQVFIANVPGQWIYPDQTSAEALAAVVRECPSGALTYKSKGSIEDEKAPPVNVMRLYENGPYAFLADLQVDGKKAGYRATLCRCGQSKRKPFCDHSHFDAGFIASGEPDTITDQALEFRGGKLEIQRLNNGPLSIKGRLEICAGTGRVVLRCSQVNLCRCGHSKSKPVCDATHLTIGFIDTVETAKPDLEV